MEKVLRIYHKHSNVLEAKMQDIKVLTKQQAGFTELPHLFLFLRSLAEYSHPRDNEYVKLS